MRSTELELILLAEHQMKVDEKVEDLFCSFRPQEPKFRRGKWGLEEEEMGGRVIRKLNAQMEELEFQTKKFFFEIEIL